MGKFSEKEKTVREIYSDILGDTMQILGKGQKTINCEKQKAEEAEWKAGKCGKVKWDCLTFHFDLFQ